MFIVPKILYIKSSCVDIIGNYHQIEGKEGTNNAAYTKGGTDGQIRRRLKRVALAVSEALKAIFFPCSFLLFVTFQIMLGRLCLTRSRDFVICLYTCIRRHLKETVLWGTITWSKMGKQTFKLKGLLYLIFFLSYYIQVSACSSLVSYIRLDGILPPSRRFAVQKQTDTR